jgi:proteasome lid subunit RPN8/RPN11
MDLTSAKREAWIAAQKASPHESCGLFVEINGTVQYWPCRNLAISSGLETQNFILDPQDFSAAESAGSIIAVVHSHPDGYPLPSHADLASCELWGFQWFIVSPHLADGGLWHSFSPCGYRAPLLGRVWSWGCHDCFSLVRDWYCDRGVVIRDFVRPNDPKDFLASPLFCSLFKQAGFFAVDDERPQPGDCALMRIGRSSGLNHVGVFTEDMRLLHHLQGRLSGTDLYGEGLRKCTGLIVRHVAWRNLILTPATA